MDVPHLTEDEMAEIKKDVLINLRHYLCTTIIPERHLDYLRSKRILTRDDAEEISCRSTQTKRTSRLLDVLSENPRGLDALIESIQQTRTQNFIIAKITDAVQKAKNEKIESLRAEASAILSDSLTPVGPSGDLSRTFSNESTMLFHPDGEDSPSSSDMVGSLSLPSIQKPGESSFCGDGGSAAVSSSPASSSSTLPRPGDPGAPALPQELLLVDQSSHVDAGAHGCSSSGGDSNFQPLRSRSLTPTSPQRDIYTLPPKSQ